MNPFSVKTACTLYLKLPPNLYPEEHELQFELVT